MSKLERSAAARVRLEQAVATAQAAYDELGITSTKEADKSLPFHPRDLPARCLPRSLPVPTIYQPLYTHSSVVQAADSQADAGVKQDKELANRLWVIISTLEVSTFLHTSYLTAAETKLNYALPIG